MCSPGCRRARLQKYSDKSLRSCRMPETWWAVLVSMVARRARPSEDVGEDALMRIVDRGILNLGEPGSRRAISTIPTLTPLPNGRLLATYRVGTTKDSDDQTIELRRSDDGGRTWSEPVAPFETTVDGTRGSLKVVYVTPTRFGPWG